VSPTTRRLSLTVLSCALLFLAGAGCSQRASRVVAPEPTAPAPEPNSPGNALQLLRYDWEHRAPGPYGLLFTEDYVFVFSERDSAGKPFLSKPWGREDELASAEHMFVTGTATDPPASSIWLDYPFPLITYPDDRDGKDARWHKQIRAQVLLRFNRGDSGFEVKGAELFYLVRGDSALIPPELRDQGFGPDSSRWWIERWVDESLQDQSPAPARLAPPAAAQPTRAWSLGAIKALYR